MNVSDFLDRFRRSEHAGHVVAWRAVARRSAEHAPWPDHVDERIVRAFAAVGIDRPYSHQSEAIAAAIDGRNVVVVTPTASGKTLCYNIPVLQSILENPSHRALYIFPTKALAQDQLAELNGVVERVGTSIRVFTYDGDTPANARRAVRIAGHVVVTNPDMLHTGILPHHTQWHQLFSNLRYVVLDEMHTYRGVFGSNVANVIRRLKRLCEHYGSRPQFILSSATIANPAELANRLIEEPVTVVDRNGAPTGEKHLIFYNPPIVNRHLGLRAGAVLTARALTANLMANGIHTILFSRSRLTVELLLSYLRDDAARLRIPIESVQGYRAGYLPNERRKIERDLREGKIRAIVSTNALELGIDIGGLEACVMAGYPGTIASTWQQIGRAGRRDSAALAIIVASSNPLDQFVINHPDYFLESPIESGRLDPDNPWIRSSHVKCAAFELPFSDGDTFGDTPLQPILDTLGGERVLYRSRDRWFWSSEAFPAHEISLRSVETDNVVIVDQTKEADPKVIGELDRLSAATMLHDEAIYLHGGQQYEVVRLDWEEKKAYVRRVAVDYFTDANLATRLAVIDQFDQADFRAWGEVSLTVLATIFKKVKFETHENVGWGKIRIPEDTFHTMAYWLVTPEGATDGWKIAEIEESLAGVGHVIGHVASLYLMCDRRDLGVAPETRSPHTGLPTVYVYDAVPGGVGFAERLFAMHDRLLEGAAALVNDCPCDVGCPSCVGAPVGTSDGTKQRVKTLLAALSLGEATERA